MKFLQMLVLIMLPVLTQAQGTLSGIVKDEQNQPLGFVNVAVLKVESGTVVTGAIAGAEGSFEIVTPAAGQYKLKLSMIGYTPIETLPFEVTGSNFSKGFGAFILKEDTKVLSEVNIVAIRPTVITYANKMVVNVEGTAMAGGATAFEVLSKSPGVWVDQEGSIKLNGKAGVQVMIDGRPAYLSGKELQRLLQTMPADNIKDLEITTNPTAKYDAEGASGLININLKKNTLSGFIGSVYAGYQYNWLHGYNAGSDLNYKKGNWSLFANLDLAERTRYRTNNMLRTYRDKDELNLQQQVLETGTRFIPALRLGSDYTINSRHSIGFLSSISEASAEENINTDAYLRNNQPENDLYIKAANNTRSKYSNYTFNLHYLGQHDTPGTTLSADLDYVRLTNEDKSSFLNNYDSLSNDAPLTTILLSTENPAFYDIYAARLDYKTAVGTTGKVEVGAKASRVVSDNELLFYENTDGYRKPDANRSNHFIYHENIFAAYASFSKSFGSKWSLQGGLRAEQTITNGRSVTLDEKNKKSYLDLFPNLFVQQHVNDNYQISYSYSRRIGRPQYSALNPFVVYLDPYSLLMGNPQLKPQYTHSFSMAQTLQQRYNLVMDYALTTDFVAEVPAYTSAENVTLFQQQNLDNMHSISATLVAPVRIAAQWEMNNNATVLYQSFAQSRGNLLLENEQLTFMMQSNHNVQLPLGTRLEVNAGYQSPVAYGLYELESNWWVDAGLKCSFMNDRLDLSLNVTDIFKSKQIQGKTRMEDYTIRSQQYQGSQSIRVNLRFRFNKGEKFDSKKRNVSLDEVKRAGGN